MELLQHATSCQEYDTFLQRQAVRQTGERYAEGKDAALCNSFSIIYF